MMNRKQIFMILGITMISMFSMLGCKSKENSIVNDNMSGNEIVINVDGQQSNDEARVIGSAEEEPIYGGEIVVESSISKVTVTIPAARVVGADETVLRQDAEARGIEEVDINVDGSVTYHMSKEVYNELLKSVLDDLNNETKALVDNQDMYASYQEIKYSEDYRTITVVCEKDTFNEEDKYGTLGLQMQCEYYLALSGVQSKDIEVSVEFVDEEGQTL